MGSEQLMAINARVESMSKLTPALENHIEQAMTRAVDYLASRQCRNGGFCHYRTDDLEEPNIRDTYYAVAAYRLVQRDVPNRDRLLDYLQSMGICQRQSSYLYYYAFTAYLLDEPVLNRGLLENLSALDIKLPLEKATVLSEWLKHSYRVVHLQKTFAGYLAFSELAGYIRQLLRSGGVGVKPNLVDTHLTLSILADLNSLEGLQNTRDFVDRLQFASLGFRYTEDSFSPATMGTLYAGVISCARLGLPVRYFEDVLNSVLLSQRSHGGFARSPGGFGDLSTHYRALRIINRLRHGYQ